jgi:hypothetical protein
VNWEPINRLTVNELKVLRFDGVAARNMSQLEPNGAKEHLIA